MTISITSSDVEEIIEVDADIDLTPFITAATSLVTKHCEEKNSAYTESELNLIAVWLSAHCYCVRDPRATFESVGKLQSTYQSKVDLCLYTSHYGQMAMMLDWYGGLAALNDLMTKNGGRRTVGITWLGEEDEELEE